MSAIIVLILISITVALGFLIAFFWAVKDGQYDDEYTPSIRMLWDDNKPSKSKEKDKNLNANTKKKQ
ncbi:MAG: cbb3-type cytochrome oxidase assembly protein CcoS [Chitinophagales bacterium]